MSEMTGEMTVPMAPGELAEVLGRSLDIVGSTFLVHQASLVHADVAARMLPDRQGCLVHEDNRIALQAPTADGGRMQFNLVSRQYGAETSINHMTIPPHGSRLPTVQSYLEDDLAFGLVRVEKNSLPGMPEHARDQISSVSDEAVALAGLSRYHLLPRLYFATGTVGTSVGRLRGASSLIGPLMVSSGRAIADCHPERQADVSLKLKWSEPADAPQGDDPTLETPQHAWIKSSNADDTASVSFALLYTGRRVAACTLKFYDEAAGIDTQEFAHTVDDHIEHMTIQAEGDQSTLRHVIPTTYSKISGMAARARRYAAGNIRVSDLI